MNDMLFFKNFNFKEVCFKEYRHNDNSNGANVHFIGFIKKGSAVLSMGGKKLELNVGDMFYIPKGCRYHSYWTPDGEMRFDSLGFRYFPSRNSGGYALQKIEYDNNLYNFYKPLSDSKEITVSSVGRLYTLLGILENILKTAPIDTDTAVSESLILMMENDPNKTMAEYAAACGVGESSLYLHVKKALKKSPNRVRQEILCDKAIQLLTTTNLTVEEISGRLGFSSTSYFRKVLFSVTQKTPSEIRKDALYI